MKNFRSWYRKHDKNFAKHEMATFNFGGSRGHRGKDHTEVPSPYLQWMLSQMDSGDTNFNVTDKGKRLNNDQLKQLLNQEIQGRKGGKTAQPSQNQPRQQANPQQPQSGASWVLAKANDNFELTDHNQESHPVRKGQYVALKNNGDGTWAYATLHRGMIQYHNARMDQGELKNHFTSEKDQQGQPIRGKFASDLAKMTHVEEEKKDFKPTDEQQDIFDTFSRNMEQGIDNHMVINARAGTGKTTTLKGLAKKFSKGQRWLYLVFNSKNQKEASAEFPKQVEVKTANSFGGDVISANKGAIPSNQQRIVDVGGSGSDARLGIMQGYNTNYDSFIQSIGIGGYPPRGVHPKTKKYITRVQRTFNKIVSGIVGKAKSYGITPQDIRGEDDDLDVETIVQQHLFDTDMEKIKDAMKNDDPRDREQINDELSDFFNVDNFNSYDFEEKAIQAAEWLLKASSPGGSDEKFDQPSYTGKELKDMFKKGNKWVGLDPRRDYKTIRALDRIRDRDRIPAWKREVKALFDKSGVSPVQHSTKDYRDFDDDVWYLQQNADNIRWPRYDVVLVDEVQDFNRVQKVMLEKLIDAGAKVVAVGDPQQGIYRFRGGDHKAFGDVTEMLMNKSEQPEQVKKSLTRNWRSKPGIIDYSNQNTVVNDLQAGIPMDDDDPARITDNEYKVNKAISMLEKEFKSLGELRKDTAFISRNNAPLIKAATELMKKGMPFQVQGVNLAAETKNMVGDIADFGNLADDDSAFDFKESLDNYSKMKKGELADAERAGKRVGEERKELDDNISAITAIYDSFIEDNEDGGNLYQLKKFVSDRLGGGKEGITLTTAHKSKGLEFDRVYDIAPSLYGSSSKLKKARQLHESIVMQLSAKLRQFIDNGQLSKDDLEMEDDFLNAPLDSQLPSLVNKGKLSDEEFAELKKMIKKAKNFELRATGDASQEDHARYVANTRARHELHILDDSPEEDDDEEDQQKESLDYSDFMKKSPQEIFLDFSLRRAGN